MSLVLRSQALAGKGEASKTVQHGTISTVVWISINDSMLASVCYTVIYMVRVGLGLV